MDRLDCLEGAETSVAAVQLHIDQAGRDRAHRRTPVADDAVADDVESPHLLDQIPRELGSLPVAIDDRQHFGVDEVSGAFQIVTLSVGQLIA